MRGKSNCKRTTFYPLSKFQETLMVWLPQIKRRRKECLAGEQKRKRPLRCKKKVKKGF